MDLVERSCPSLPALIALLVTIGILVAAGFGVLALCLLLFPPLALGCWIFWGRRFSKSAIDPLCFKDQIPRFFENRDELCEFKSSDCLV